MKNEPPKRLDIFRDGPAKSNGRAGRAVIVQGDCLAVLPTLPAESVDAVVTDPPYHLTSGKRGGAGQASENLASPAGRSRATTGFMGKAWDGGDLAHSPAVWREVLRVAKPGTHLLAFGGTRTFHRLACAIEDAGWEIRDTVMWVYGSGFPKSLDVSKAIDKATGAERNHALHTREDTGFRFQSGGTPSTPPITDAARRWEGWGTALKPAWEPIIIARKPLGGTVAENVLRHGTGAMNIDGCRVSTNGEAIIRTGLLDDIRGGGYKKDSPKKRTDFGVITRATPPAGRWPANLIHDGSEEVVGLFPQSGGGFGTRGAGGHTYGSDRTFQGDGRVVGFGDSGSAARFFYTAKASGRERWFFCRDCRDAYPMAVHDAHGHGHVDAAGKQTWDHTASHPTQKPESLMRYLSRIVTPPGGVVLDPFMGSGSTGKAAVLEDFRFVGIELDADYLSIAANRIKAAVQAGEEDAPLFAAMELSNEGPSPPLARREKGGPVAGDGQAGALSSPGRLRARVARGPRSILRADDRAVSRD